MGAKADVSHMTPLAATFSPGPHDVICARGKEAKNHEGNRRYTKMIESSLDRYAKLASKYEKTLVVSEIVEAVRRSSPDGGFVKKENGRWYEVGDHLAREKVGQNLRDRLSNLYKSSTKAKRKRRANEQKEIAGDVEGLIQNNVKVAGRLDKLSEEMKARGEAPEVFMSAMFSQANRDILEAMKKDQSLVTEFRKAEEQVQKSSKTEPLKTAV